MMTAVANFYANLYASIANWCTKKMQSLSRNTKACAVNTKEEKEMITECPFTGQYYEEYTVKRYKDALARTINEMQEHINQFQFSYCHQYVRHGMATALQILRHEFKGLIK